MIRVQLSDDQAQPLEQAYRQATDGTFRDRLQIIRLAHRGRKHKDIAADLGITARTVQNGLNAYVEGGSTPGGHARPRGPRPRSPPRWPT